MALTGESLRSWVRGTSATGVVLGGLIAAATIPMWGTAGLVAGLGIAALGVTGVLHSVVAKPDDMARTARNLQNDFNAVTNLFRGTNPAVQQPGPEPAERQPVAGRAIPYSDYVAQHGYNPDAIQMPVAKGVVPDAAQPPARQHIQFAATSRATMPSP